MFNICFYTECVACMQQKHLHFTGTLNCHSNLTFHSCDRCKQEITHHPSDIYILVYRKVFILPRHGSINASDTHRSFWIYEHTIPKGYFSCNFLLTLNANVPMCGIYIMPLRSTSSLSLSNHESSQVTYKQSLAYYAHISIATGLRDEPLVCVDPKMCTPVEIKIHVSWV